MCRLYLLVPVTSYWFHAQRSTGQTLVLSLALYTLSRLSSSFLYVSSASVFMFSSNPQSSHPFAFVSFYSFVLTKTRLSYCVLPFTSWLSVLLFPPFFLSTDFHVSLSYPVSYINVLYFFSFSSPFYTSLFCLPFLFVCSA